ncbi:MAG: DotA/TraY family protein [Cyanobacteria bacterium P01_A01_bin.17]
MAPIAEMMSLIHTCAFAHFDEFEFVSKNPAGVPPSYAGGKFVLSLGYPETAAWAGPYLNVSTGHVARPYLVKKPTAQQIALGGLAAQENLIVVPGTTYEQAREFYAGGDIIIRFGRVPIDHDGGGLSPSEIERYEKYPGLVEPTCGDVRIPIKDRRETNASNVHPTDGYLGTVAVQRFYFELIRDLWSNFAESETYIDFAGRQVLLPGSTATSSACQMGCDGGLNPNPFLPSTGCGSAVIPPPPPPPPPVVPDTRCARAKVGAEWKQEEINRLQGEVENIITTVWTQENTQTTAFDVDPALLQRGWGGAGIWFNTIAQVNGNFIAAWMDVPSFDRYPAVMEEVFEERTKIDQSSAGSDRFSLNYKVTVNGKESTKSVNISGLENIAKTLDHVYRYWHEDVENAANVEMNKGAFERGMNLVFGTYGLFAMRDRDIHVHPLAQLTALGKGLVESTIRNVGGATATAALGGLIKFQEENAGSALQGLSGLLGSTAFIGMTAGLVLFYVLPFLPFVYFYFAVGQWVKSIFEAMVGVPLWALAHLRLDGEGLPGDSAANGYFLIFEIFIRPILTVFGLVAAMILFTAQVRILNFIWSLVTQNVGGFDNSAATFGFWQFDRSIIDDFFFTVVYAIIVYMIATASFKLIDKIPDNILRWMGQGVSSFGDINEDPTQSLTKYAALGGLTAGQKAAGAVQGLAGGTGSAIGGSLGRLGAGFGNKIP